VEASPEPQPALRAASMQREAQRRSQAHARHRSPSPAQEESRLGRIHGSPLAACGCGAGDRDSGSEAEEEEEERVVVQAPSPAKLVPALFRVHRKPSKGGPYDEWRLVGRKLRVSGLAPGSSSEDLWKLLEGAGGRGGRRPGVAAWPAALQPCRALWCRACTAWDPSSPFLLSPPTPPCSRFLPGMARQQARLRGSGHRHAAHSEECKAGGQGIVGAPHAWPPAPPPAARQDRGGWHQEARPRRCTHS
jgi:hypothetical protein